jgi:hypothetical protein
MVQGPSARCSAFWRSRLRTSAPRALAASAATATSEREEGGDLDKQAGLISREDQVDLDLLLRRQWAHHDLAHAAQTVPVDVHHKRVLWPRLAAHTNVSCGHASRPILCKRSRIGKSRAAEERARLPRREVARERGLRRLGQRRHHAVARARALRIALRAREVVVHGDLDVPRRRLEEERGHALVSTCSTRENCATNASWSFFAILLNSEIRSSAIPARARRAARQPAQHGQEGLARRAAARNAARDQGARAKPPARPPSR